MQQGCLRKISSGCRGGSDERNFTVFAILLLTQVLSPGVQNKQSVSGLVIRAGTTEPLSDTEVTLNVAPPSAAFFPLSILLRRKVCRRLI